MINMIKSNPARNGFPHLVDYQYKGPGSRRAYFEGWYFKLSLDQDTTLSLIPSLHKQDDQVYGSLQWIQSKGGQVQTGVKIYPAGEYDLSLHPFRLVLGNSSFEESGITIREEELKLSAQFLKIHTYPRDIMGPFGPLHRIMPCSHGLLVTHGQARVSLESESLSGRFDARLYVEKDWGDTFPQRYIWTQADFPGQNASLFFSIATVKVGWLRFNGFIANLHLDGENHTFATWNLAHCRIRGNEHDIRIGLGDSTMTLAARLLPRNTAPLNSPVQGVMNSTVRESLSAPLKLRVRDSLGLDRKFQTDKASVECHNWF